MVQKQQRKKREEIKKFPGGSAFSKWITIMIPKNSAKKSVLYKKRKGEGLRRAHNPFPDKKGFYEVRIIPPHQTNAHSIVIYGGMAGQNTNNSTLKSRWHHYMYDGSHKANLYNALLKAGFTIEVRYIMQGIDTRRITGEKKNKAVESFYLSRFDYAANIMENGKMRLNEIITIDKSGKKKTLEEILKDNGYVAKNRSEARPMHNPAISPPPPSSPLKKIISNKKIQSSIPPIHILTTRGYGNESVQRRDLRHMTNAKLYQQYLSQLSIHGMNKLGSYSGVQVPLKHDGTPDRRYAINKWMFLQ